MDQAGFVGDALRDAPCDIGVWDESVGRGFERDQLSFTKSGLDEDAAIGDDGACACAVLCALFESPEFFAGCGVVAVVGFCAAGDEDGFSVEGGDEWGCERLPVVAIA